MQISLNWFKDFVNIPKSITPEELGLRLTMHTVEIDGVKSQSDKYKNIVVGKILEIKKHPNADRLQLVKVDIGKIKLDIVCGAVNIKAGQFAPVALAGAILPNGIEIKEAAVRGEKSEGMLCAPDELGLGDDHSGILILDQPAKIGVNLSDYLNLKDIVFAIDNKSITHRPDLWSHYGLAREIAAFLNTKFKPFKYNNKLLKSAPKIELKAKVDDFTLCPRYMAVAMEGIVIAESPQWMKERLMAVGMRPINNIVDITNYVMLEMGQPLHAVDAAKIKQADGYKILVRRAKDGETMETLDSEARKLDSETLVITDGRQPLALAGVMGGLGSEINSTTKTIILESANFNFLSIRKTVQKLGLRTESSMRFEKALDPNLCELALARAVELIKKIIPRTKVISNLVDLSAVKAGGNKYGLNQGPIELDLNWLERRMGVIIDNKKIINILESLGFVVKASKEKLEVIVPTWRATRDISIPEDLLEEAARIYGYNKLAPAMPKIKMQKPCSSPERIYERKIKNILAGAGVLTEVYNYSYVGEDQLKKLNIDYTAHLKILNPIAAHQTMLRQSLAPNLINNIKTNQARHDLMALFEIGNVYFSTPGNIKKDATGNGHLPYQERRIGIIFGGRETAAVFGKVKSVIGLLAESFNLTVKFNPSETIYNWADQQICAFIEIEGKIIGSIVKLDSRLQAGLGLKKEVAVAEINFNDFINAIMKKSNRGYKELDKYPQSARDLAFVVNAQILYNDIKKRIENFDKLIKAVELFDVYEGGQLGKDKKSLAFHITYQADRTLTSAEVDNLQQKLIKDLKEKFAAKIRDF